MAVVLGSLVLLRRLNELGCLGPVVTLFSRDHFWFMPQSQTGAKRSCDFCFSLLVPVLVLSFGGEAETKNGRVKRVPPLAPNRE